MITSEEKIYGGTNKKFEDGKVFKAQLKTGKWIEIFFVCYIHSLNDFKARLHSFHGAEKNDGRKKFKFFEKDY